MLSISRVIAALVLSIATLAAPTIDAMQYVSRVRKEDAHDDGIWSVAWSANGQIVTGSCDEVVQTYMVHGQQIEKKHELRGHHLGVTSVSVSAEGNLAASSALDSHIRLWDLEKGEEVRTIDAGPVEAWTVAVSPDGATVASGRDRIVLWDLAGKKVRATHDVLNGNVKQLHYLPGGDLLTLA